MTNTGTGVDLFRLAASTAEGWDVQLQHEVIEVPAGGSVEVPVFVRVPAGDDRPERRRADLDRDLRVRRCGRLRDRDDQPGLLMRPSSPVPAIPAVPTRGGARPMTRHRRTVLGLVVLATALFGFVPASSDAPTAVGPRPDADYSEAYFTAGDGVTNLHADILRPAGFDLTDANPTPVILTVTPYANHSGSTTELGVGNEGPNPRFYDFLDLSGALEQGYTYVMVDLPGFGGSGGCNDWGGNREQDAVRAAVEWAASQPWSTGKVGLLGKSYDGWTGLMGIAQQPKGLAAVASLEPVFAGYRYIYNNGIHRSPTAATIGLFQVIDAKPGTTNDTPQYNANGAPQAWCYGVNLAGSNADIDPHGPYWLERDLLLETVGRTTPLFLTQGFLETNTLEDGAFQYWNGLAGGDNRAWFAQIDHCRAWETQKSCDGGGTDERMVPGRGDFIAQLMRFFDEHLKGIEPAVDDPTVEVQDAQGRWRAESQWPPADVQRLTTELRPGTYADDGAGRGDRPTPSQGIWSVSEPLPHDVWLSGEPTLTVGVDAVPNANLAANVYDIAPDGSLLEISRGVSLLWGTGQRSLTLPMYGQDWPLAAGHRIGVLIGPANTDGFTHVPTNADVTVRSARISLPFLTYDRTEFTPSDGTTPRLEAFRAANRSGFDEAFLTEAEVPFTLPAPLRAR